MVDTGGHRGTNLMSEHSGIVTVRPMAGWLGMHHPQAEELAELTGDRPTQKDLIRIKRSEYRKELISILGMVMTNCTVLQQLNDKPLLGPAQDRHGRVLRWSMWSPHRRLLIDVFHGKLPPPEELEDRQAFATAHDLKYGLVAPGERLELDLLKEWINGHSAG